MEKVKLRFLPTDRVIEVDKGERLHAAIMAAGIYINAPCGGDGYCGKCRVIVVEGEVRQRDQEALTGEELAQGYVLACQSTVEGDAVIRIPEGTLIEDTGVLNREAVRAREADGAAPAEIAPPVQTFRLSLPVPTLDDPVSDADRVKRGLLSAHGIDGIQFSLEILRELPGILRGAEYDILLSVLFDGAVPRVISVCSAGEAAPSYAVAIDLGTTTVAAELIRIEDGAVVASAADYNSQISIGEDIISRIIHAGKPGGIDNLQTAVVRSIERLVFTVLENEGLSTRDLSHIMVSGNTTMAHLLLGIDPTGIRLEPYVPAARSFPWVPAGEIAPFGEEYSGIPVRLTPAVASYVGGDIVAGILASGMRDSEQLSIYLDVGTNGESVLGNSEWLVCCSCSAGPSFEGAGVKDGMRAVAGAIERVRVDVETLEPAVSVIGGVAATGICGSGLIDLLAELFVAGVVDERGKIDRSLSSKSDRVRSGGHSGEYVVVSADENPNRREIIITDVDIDNLMRTKAAVHAALEVLLEEVGITIDMVKHVYVAGAFGRFIDVERAVRIGLLPDMDRERFSFVGNGSLAGTRMIAASRDLVLEADEIARSMTYLELAANRRFMDSYVSALFLPHTDLERFPTVKSVIDRTRGKEGA